ncbi:MAG: M48 family metallopeptidase [Proteobacteria bacterium]|nr:M48 family metallopeptidase [Burkholderiales bacterium]
MHPFTTLFLFALAAATAVKLWLALRHMQHVRAHRDRVPPEFAAAIPVSSHRTAADYTVAKGRVDLLEIPFDALVVLALTLGGGLSWLDATLRPLLGDGLLHGVGLIGAVVVITSALSLPASLYRTFVIEQRFGFNKMTLAMYIGDLLRNALLGTALGLPLLAAVLWLMGEMGNLWWLYAWVVWVVFNLTVLAVYPTFIAPLFNKFSPLQDTVLEARVRTLLERCGFHAQGLFVMDGSKRSSHGNAYFTGLGRSKRIVFFDTLLSRLTPEEIEAVLAHELGHFKLRHVAKRIVWTFAASLGFLALLAWIATQPWFYSALGVDQPSTSMALLLFFTVLPSFTFLLSPLFAWYSRRHEFEADHYAAHHARAADLVHALVKLYKDNASTLTPDPVHSMFYDSHPPAAIRIARLQAAAS